MASLLDANLFLPQKSYERVRLTAEAIIELAQGIITVI